MRRLINRFSQCALSKLRPSLTEGFNFDLLQAWLATDFQTGFFDRLLNSPRQTAIWYWMRADIGPHLYTISSMFSIIYFDSKNLRILEAHI